MATKTFVVSDCDGLIATSRKTPFGRGFDWDGNTATAAIPMVWIDTEIPEGSVWTVEEDTEAGLLMFRLVSEPEVD